MAALPDTPKYLDDILTWSDIERRMFPIESMGIFRHAKCRSEFDFMECYLRDKKLFVYIFITSLNNQPNILCCGH